MDIFNKKELTRVKKALKIATTENARLKKENARLIKDNFKLSANQNVSGLNARVENSPNIPKFDVPPVGVLATTLGNKGIKDTEKAKVTQKSSYEYVE